MQSEMPFDVKYEATGIISRGFSCLQIHVLLAYSQDSFCLILCNRKSQFAIRPSHRRHACLYAAAARQLLAIT